MKKRKIDFLGDKQFKKKLRIGVLSILLTLTLLLGFSYAWFTFLKQGDKQNIVKVGNLSLNLSEGEPIKLEVALPTSIEMALDGTPYHFEIENEGTVDANYQIYLDNTGTIDEPNMFYYALKKDGKLISMGKLDTISSNYEGAENAPLFLGNIDPLKKAEKAEKYDLYIWLDYNEDGSSLTETDYYEGTIRLEATQQKKKPLITEAINTCKGLSGCTREENGITYFQHDYYSDENRVKYVWYSGKLWILMSYDEEGNIKMMTENPQTFLPFGPNASYVGSYVETWLNEEFLKTLNHYEKMLVTNYSWNYTPCSISDETHYCTSASETPVTVISPVGLMNSFELYQGTYQEDGYVTPADYILRFGGEYYLGNSTPENKIILGGTGAMGSDYGMHLVDEHTSGISPMVVLKKGVMIRSGSGTKEDPYQLEGDESGKTGTLLNSRFQGEYVAFGEGVNFSYRISSVENGLTKIVSSILLLEQTVNDTQETIDVLNKRKNGGYLYPYTTTDDLNRFDANSSEYPLAYFLNHEFLSPENGYLTSDDVAMIATNTNWYPGVILKGESYKKLRIPSNANVATVGLLSLGEGNNVISPIDSFSLSQSTTTSYNPLLVNYGTKLWASAVQNFPGNGPFRPSMYLKDNVKIKSGSGTKMDPYILTLG